MNFKMGKSSNIKCQTKENNNPVNEIVTTSEGGKVRTFDDDATNFPNK